MTMKYRKIPVVIDAEQFTGSETQAKRLGMKFITIRGRMHEAGWFIVTLEGNMRVDVGAWVITGVKGEKYPCADEIFKLTYEPYTPRDVNTEHPDGGRLG
jgi:hypothetical protein